MVVERQRLRPAHAGAASAPFAATAGLPWCAAACGILTGRRRLCGGWLLRRRRRLPGTGCRCRDADRENRDGCEPGEHALNLRTTRSEERGARVGPRASLLKRISERELYEPWIVRLGFRHGAEQRRSDGRVRIVPLNVAERVEHLDPELEGRAAVQLDRLEERHIHDQGVAAID